MDELLGHMKREGWHLEVKLSEGPYARQSKERRCLEFNAKSPDEAMTLKGMPSTVKEFVCVVGDFVKHYEEQKAMAADRRQVEAAL